MSDPRNRLRSNLYMAAKHGMALVMTRILNDARLEDEKDILNERYRDKEGQECTPLIIAAREGHDRVVRTLLTLCKPDLEQEGTVKFDGYVIEGASALWCAACAGHLNVVKTLVKVGADVNHPTKSNSTPLRAACFDGRLDIVKYLTFHKADINIANKYNNTCLMIAAFKGHLDVVSFLLEMGANVNEKARCGATALHFAAECGHLNVVVELLQYKAAFSLNDAGLTPLLAAAERTRAEVVEYLVQRPEITKEQQIEALELLGASYANDKDTYDIIKAYKYIHRAMKLRFSDPLNPIKKNILPPIAAYEHWVESQTLFELETIQTNYNSLHMEALTIRERVLGTQNPEVPHPIIYRGAVFADCARFDRCLELWLHALKLRQLNHISVAKDLLRFAQVFSQMLHLHVKVLFDNVIEVLSAAITELERNKEKLSKPELNIDLDVIKEELECNLTTTLYLLTILTKLIDNCSEEEIFNLKRMVFILNELKLTQSDGQTLLHLACNAETPVDDFHTNDICRFPCIETTRLLINCGADVNAMDCERNTPLHTIVKYHKPLSDFKTLYSIIWFLTEAGAHLDYVNIRGETPLESAATGSVAEIILKTYIKLNLKCIAANAINNYNIKYHGHVPQSLEPFIELHGSGISKKSSQNNNK